MALLSSVTVLVAHPEPRSQPAIASKNTFFITCIIDPSAMIAHGKEQSGELPLPKIPNGFLTHPNGSPNGSNFYKCLIRRKVYGLTGKTPPGDPTAGQHCQSSPQGYGSVISRRVIRFDSDCFPISLEYFARRAWND